MKKTLLILFLIGTLISCQNFQKETQQQLMYKHIELELASGVRNDTIFLGFWFGMTENEFLSHLKKLKRENKLNLNALNNYEYEFDFGENSIPSKGRATFGVDYFNNKLFKFTIFVTSDDLISNAELIQLKLVNIYGSKYGHSYYKQKSILDDSDTYIWIDGNRKITLLVGIDEARIFYIDLIAEKAKEKQDDKETIEKRETIISDI